MTMIAQAASLAADIPETTENFRSLRELKALLKDDVAAKAAHLIRTGLGDGRLDLATVLQVLEGNGR
jgi:hypothetical protein